MLRREIRNAGETKRNLPIGGGLRTHYPPDPESGALPTEQLCFGDDLLRRHDYTLEIAGLVPLAVRIRHGRNRRAAFPRSVHRSCAGRRRRRSVMRSNNRRAAQVKICAKNSPLSGRDCSNALQLRRLSRPTTTFLRRSVRNLRKEDLRWEEFSSPL